MPREVPCDLFALIEYWSQTVSEQADHSVQRSPPSPRNLRPRPTPRPQPSTDQPRTLAPTSGNRRRRKAPADQEGENQSAAEKKPAKRARKMLGNTGKEGDPVGKGGDPVKKNAGAKRGRPPGSKNKAQPVLPSSAILAPPSPSKSSSKGKSGSPKRGKSRANAKVDANIDLEYLKSCKPSVWPETPDEAIETGRIPPETLTLYQMLDDVPLGCIPAQLKVEYAQEQQKPLKASFFLPLDANPFPEGCLQSLKQTVEEVVKYTAWNSSKEAHERQWGTTTITPLIHEVKRWPELQPCVLMNVESCAVEPIEIRMERPDGKLLEIETAETTETRESTGESASTTTRMVDLSIGLRLKGEHQGIIHSAFNRMLDNDQSLNQSLSYIRGTPIFLDFELKKTNSNRDPQVQLAIWKAGMLRKMQYHGWDLSMPMPGVTINGADWECHLFFMRDSKFIMMGPLKMGSTHTINGTFEIAYRLYILMKWGKTEYEPWFKKHILTWCQHKAAGTIPVEAGLTSLQL